jgi:hypothetical protein
MSGPPSQDEREKLPCLHIHAQLCWHEPAHIRGTRTALENLRDAIGRCLATGADSEAGAITADNESYGVVVQMTSLDALRKDRLPYTADFAAEPPTASTEPIASSEASE